MSSSPPTSPAAPSPEGALPVADTLPVADALPLADALRWWWALGWLSFGGPAGQIALMHREVVERRRWVSEERFVHALDYCMLLPGPEAQQLATYLGWILHGTWGGIAAGALFVLPGLLVMIALSWGYVAFGALPVVASIFWALKPAVLGIVVAACLRLGRSLGTDRFGAVLAGAAFLALTLVDAPFPVVMLVALALSSLRARMAARESGAVAAPGGPVAGAPVAGVHGADSPPPASPNLPSVRPSLPRLARIVGIGVALGTVAYVALTLLGGELATMAGFFTRVALLSVGGAYAALPYVWQGAVGTHGWLTGQQVVDGLALGETTPGPLVLVFTYVGFVGSWQHPPDGWAPWAAGLVGALTATFFTFLPSFVFILGGAPWVEAGRLSPRWKPALAGVRAATVGVVLHLGVLFGATVLLPGGTFDPWAAALSALAIVAAVRWRLGVGWLIGGAVALGGLRAVV